MPHALNLSRISLVAALCVSSFAQSPKPVSTESGELVGSLKDGVRIYLGIPYAQPPVGPLRWKAAQPVKHSTAVLPADKLGPACPQNLSRSRLPWTEEFMVQNEASEDCLNLNIWAPVSGKSHAVLVFIHGGGFSEGSNGITTYDGTSLAKKGIVVVDANYRLGLLGNFASSELVKESPEHTAGNYSITDIIETLRWVKKNIAALGGDPMRVTLAGQSAGAMAVDYIVNSPVAKGLFQRAIINSAPPLWPSAELTELPAAAAAGDKFTAAHGGSLAALRAMSAEDVLAAKDAGPEVRRPVAGGTDVPSQPGTMVQSGGGSDVPVVLGWVADDGILSPTYGELTAAQFRAEAEKKYGSRAGEFLKLYPATDDATAKTSQIAATRDRYLAIAALWAEAWRGRHRSPVYLYYVARVPSWPAHPEFGMHHTGELPYFFGTLDKTMTRKYDATDNAVSEAAQRSWVSFAESGNPGAPWKASANPHGPFTIVDQPMTSQPKLDGEKEVFWRTTLEPR